MPPKRKTTGAGNEGSKKPRKIPGSGGDSPKPRRRSSDIPGTSEVRWGLPSSNAKDDDTRDVSDNVTQYALTLYSQDWNHLKTREAPFGFPRLRTPLYKKITPLKENESGISQVVLDFFNVIKLDSQPPRKGDALRPPGPYARTAFVQAFGDDDDAPAVVASRSTAHPVLALTEDYQLQVTIRDGDRNESVHINLLRRAPPLPLSPETPATEHGYFIELPPDTNITVNGRTYVNVRVEDDAAGVNGETAATLPFIIGPLARYTVLELLSEPIFFFRQSGDLSFTGPLARKSSSPEEQPNRAKNRQVAVDETTVTWTRNVTLAQSVRDLQESSQPLPKLKDQTKAVQGSASTPSPETNTPVDNDSQNSDSTASQKPQDRGEYDDTWTSQGEAIVDPCIYLSHNLGGPLRDHYDQLIPRVLVSINDRQEPIAGFSVDVGETVLRPGRTLIAPLPHPRNSHHVLLVFQLQSDGFITLHVLDPIAWRTALDERQTIFDQARQLLIDRDWWRDVFGSSEDLATHFPHEAQWIDCAQTPQAEEANTFTILNAWALAMGLEPDPSFIVDQIHGGGANFFTQAHWLFDLALEDRLHWKLLLAFFRCTGFVKRQNQAGGKGKGKGKANDDDDDDEGGGDAMPPRNRRFDLRVVPFQQALNQQRELDNAAYTGPDRRTIDYSRSKPAVSLGEGRAHTADFASDHWPEAFEEDVIIPLIRRGQWTLAATQEQLKERFDQLRQNGASPSRVSTGTMVRPDDLEISSTKSSASLPPVKVTPPEPGTPPKTLEAIATDDPCGYFHDQVNKLAKKDLENPEQGLRLDYSQVFESIAAVVRAINELQPPGDGFGLCADGMTVTSDNDPDGGPADRIILMPFMYTDHAIHAILVIVRFVDTADDDGVVVVADTIDSAPWTLGQDERAELYASALSIWEAEIPFAKTITWHYGPQQFEDWQAEYFVILNAWSVLLGLPLNKSFRPGHAFSAEVKQLIQVVLQGDADWKLIWAFLRCIGYISSESPPTPARAFKKTVSPENLEEHLERMKERSDASIGSESGVNSYMHFPQASGVPHTERFQWDDLEPEERTIRIPALKRSGAFENDLTRREINNLYHNLPRDFEPCKDFRQRLDELLQDERIASDLKDFRDPRVVTQSFGAWLRDTEISLAIASVTLAITTFQQDLNLGFGFVSQWSIQENIQNPAPILPTIRPGRPLIVPLHISQHFVLLVIQLNEDAEPTFSVLDSKAYHLDENARRIIHSWAWRLVDESHWWEHVFAENDCRKHIPAFTSWIPVAQQPSDAECGHYAILNAWTLALGLLPDPTANLDWSDQFFSDLNDVIHLARIRRADWRLIYAFLRCCGFVLEGHVPIDRQFTETVELRNEEDRYLGDTVDGLRALEDVHFSKQPTLDLPQIRNANRSALPTGRRHNDLAAFPSDHWSIWAREMWVRDVARNGRLNISHDETQLEEAYRDLRNLRGGELRLQLQAGNPNYQQQPRDQLLKACRRYLEDWHTGRDLLLQLRSCSWLEDTLDFYRYVFRSDFLGKPLRSEAFQDPTKQHKGLESSEVNLAIAAVVEAIDNLQSQIHEANKPGALFAGGFSLATSLQVEMLWAPFETDVNPASRPRRCWLMPLSVMRGGLLKKLEDWRAKEKLPAKHRPGHAAGHHLLAVLQEERDPKPHFTLHFYDSGSHVFHDSYQFLQLAVINASKRLQWSTHRNTPKRVRHVKYDTVKVPQQQGGGWQCGSHVVINAWILAMGLHPNLEKEFDDQIYSEFYTLARAACNGLLDWRTLVAWLFCRRLTTERNLNHVLVDRRFPTTRFWQNEAALAERIDEIYGDMDVLLATVGEDEVDYDLSGNPEHSVVENEEGGNTNSKIPPTQPPKSLNRMYDEPELDFLQHRARSPRKAKARKVDALHFLTGYDADGDAEMTDAFQHPTPVSQHISDKLSFLDAF